MMRNLIRLKWNLDFTCSAKMPKTHSVVSIKNESPSIEKLKIKIKSNHAGAERLLPR
jgi:hypothetical protein